MKTLYGKDTNYNKERGKPTTDLRKQDRREVLDAIANYLERQCTPNKTQQKDIESEAVAQQQRLEEKVQKLQEELETIHKKIDDLTKVIRRTQQQHSPTEEKASTPSHSQKLEDTEQQETLNKNEETRNNKPSIFAIAQDQEPTTKRPSVENHQATQNETIIKRNKQSKIEIHIGTPSTMIPEEMIIDKPPDTTTQDTPNIDSTFFHLVVWLSVWQWRY